MSVIHDINNQSVIIGMDSSLVHCKDWSEEAFSIYTGLEVNEKGFFPLEAHRPLLFQVIDLMHDEISKELVIHESNADFYIIAKYLPDHSNTKYVELVGYLQEHQVKYSRKVSGTYRVNSKEIKSIIDLRYLLRQYLPKNIKELYT